jgi:hypothetical protein
LLAFIATPFLGHKIATDEDFRKMIPGWYDFALEKPKSAWTRAEMHEMIVKRQRELHERAIRGEFSKEKLEEMRRQFKELASPLEDDDDEKED